VLELFWLLTTTVLAWLRPRHDLVLETSRPQMRLESARDPRANDGRKVPVCRTFERAVRHPCDTQSGE
jgi:hypothetical protein